MLVFTSCKLEEDDIFEASAAARLNTAKSEYKKTLCNATNGWVMEYFANTESEGYTFIMKFSESGAVTIAAKNKYTNKTYKTESSLYEIITDNGPVLTFNTYNTLFHSFSNPEDPDGYGLKGDYEFIVLKADSNEVSLKSKKYGVYVSLHKLATNQDWPQYYDILSSMNQAMFGNTSSVLQLKVNDSIVYTVKNGSMQIFSLIPNGGDELTDAILKPFIVTDKGIRLVTPIKVGDISAREFVLTDDKNQLISIDKEVNMKFIAMPPTSIFLNTINARKYMNLKYSDENMSESIKSVYATINNIVVNKTRKLEYIGFTNNKDYGTSLSVYTTKGTSKIEGFLSFSITKLNDTNLRLKFNGFTGKYDTNGKTYYDTYAVSGLVSTLEDDYTITIRDGALSASILRFTSITDTTKWFDLILKI